MKVRYNLKMDESSANDLEQLIQAQENAEALEKIKDPMILDLLIQYFKDPIQYNPNQKSPIKTLDKLLRNRSAAEEALVKIGEPAIQPLILVLEDDNYRLSEAASALNDSISFIRRSAVRALGRINGTQVIGPLIQTLVDNDPEVQREAEDQLRKNIFDKSLESSIRDSLIQALKDNDSEVRTRAKEYLERFLLQNASQQERSKKIQLQYW